MCLAAQGCKLLSVQVKPTNIKPALMDFFGYLAVETICKQDFDILAYADVANLLVNSCLFAHPAVTTQNDLAFILSRVCVHVMNVSLVFTLFLALFLISINS